MIPAAVSSAASVAFGTLLLVVGVTVVLGVAGDVPVRLIEACHCDDVERLCVAAALTPLSECIAFCTLGA